jgi:hypothetical protein
MPAKTEGSEVAEEQGSPELMATPMKTNAKTRRFTYKPRPSTTDDEQGSPTLTVLRSELDRFAREI